MFTPYFDPIRGTNDYISDTKEFIPNKKSSLLTYFFIITKKKSNANLNATIPFVSPANNLSSYTSSFTNQNIPLPASCPLPISDASQMLDHSIANMQQQPHHPTATANSSIVRLIKHDTNNNSINNTASADAASISSSADSILNADKKHSTNYKNNANKKTFAQKYLKSTSRLVRSASGSSMDLLSNLRMSCSTSTSSSNHTVTQQPNELNMTPHVTASGLKKNSLSNISFSNQPFSPPPAQSEPLAKLG